MKQRSFGGVSQGSEFRGLYLPAVDNYRARSTPVALVNLSAMKEERKKTVTRLQLRTETKRKKLPRLHRFQLNSIRSRGGEGRVAP